MKTHCKYGHPRAGNTTRKGQCLTCYEEREATRLEEKRVSARNYLSKHPNFHRDQRARDVAKAMVLHSRKGAKTRGLEFSITEADIKPLPEVCPVFGMKLEYMARGNADNVASIDRFDSSAGYVPGNVRVISYKANNIKGRATAEELTRVLEYMRQ